MPYLLHHETRRLLEISKDKAIRFAEYIDQRVKIPFGFERLDPFKCEILQELPWNWQEYKVINDDSVKKLEGPEYEEKFVDIGNNTVKKVKVLKKK